MLTAQYLSNYNYVVILDSICTIFLPLFDKTVKICQTGKLKSRGSESNAASSLVANSRLLNQRAKLVPDVQFSLSFSDFVFGPSAKIKCGC